MGLLGKELIPNKSLDHNDFDPVMKKVRFDFNQNLKVKKEDTESENGIVIGK